MARWSFVFGYGVFGFILKVSGDNKYDNHTFMQIYPNSEDEVQNVIQFEDPKEKVEILKGCRGVNDSLDLLIPEDRLKFVQEFVTKHNVTFEEQKNYGRTFEEINQTTRRMTRRYQFEYYSYNAMQDYLRNIGSSDLVTVLVRGKSFEGRTIPLVKISSKPKSTNPIIFIDAGIHAREWVAPTMALYMIHRLTTDPAAKINELNGVDWYILPLVNPDGYEFSRTTANNRLWRKTRTNYGSCYGVDGNRNYGFKWGVSGSSMACHSDTYQGPKPFSESETRIVRDIMKEYAKRIKLYVSLHSYGQYLVYPWGYTGKELPPKWPRLHSLAKKVSDAVVKSGGNPFKVLSAGQWYPAAGGSDDFAFGAIRIPYSYTMEITNGHGFHYPKMKLAKVLPSIYEGFKEFGRNIKSEFNG